MSALENLKNFKYEITPEQNDEKIKIFYTNTKDQDPYMTDLNEKVNTHQGRIEQAYYKLLNFLNIRKYIKLEPNQEGVNKKLYVPAKIVETAINHATKHLMVSGASLRFHDPYLNESSSSQSLSEEKSDRMSVASLPQAEISPEIVAIKAKIAETKSACEEILGKDPNKAKSEEEWELHDEFTKFKGLATSFERTQKMTPFLHLPKDSPGIDFSDKIKNIEESAKRISEIINRIKTSK